MKGVPHGDGVVLRSMKGVKKNNINNLSTYTSSSGRVEKHLRKVNMYVLSSVPQNAHVNSSKDGDALMTVMHPLVGPGDADVRGRRDLCKELRPHRGLCGAGESRRRFQHRVWQHSIQGQAHRDRKRGRCEFEGRKHGTALLRSFNPHDINSLLPTPYHLEFPPYIFYGSVRCTDVGLRDRGISRIDVDTEEAIAEGGAKVGRHPRATSTSKEEY